MEQQNPDCLSSYFGNELAFDGLLDHQAERPAGTAFWRLAADHGDNTLFLTGVERWFGTWPRLFVKRAVEALLLVTVAEFANRLDREWKRTGDLWRGGSSREPQESRRAQDYSDLLYAAFHQAAQLFLVFGADFDTERCTSHTFRMLLKHFRMELF